MVAECRTFRCSGGCCFLRGCHSRLVSMYQLSSTDYSRSWSYYHHVPLRLSRRLQSRLQLGRIHQLRYPALDRVWQEGVPGKPHVRPAISSRRAFIIRWLRMFFSSFSFPSYFVLFTHDTFLSVSFLFSLLFLPFPFFLSIFSSPPGVIPFHHSFFFLSSLPRHPPFSMHADA